MVTATTVNSGFVHSIRSSEEGGNPSAMRKRIITRGCAERRDYIRLLGFRMDETARGMVRASGFGRYEAQRVDGWR
jgi:hypothetical protein